MRRRERGRRRQVAIERAELSLNIVDPKEGRVFPVAYRCFDRLETVRDTWRGMHLSARRERLAGKDGCNRLRFQR